MSEEKTWECPICGKKINYYDIMKIIDHITMHLQMIIYAERGYTDE